jgi:alpha-glucosidase
VLKEVALEREVYLPAGNWYDFATGSMVPAVAPVAAKAGDETALAQVVGQTVTVPVTISTLPLYVREGGFVFSQPVVQHTGQMSGLPLQVMVFPSQHKSMRTFYEDDGETIAYRKGASCTRTFHSVQTGNSVTVTVTGCAGSYRPASRDLVFRLPTNQTVRAYVSGHETKTVRTVPGYVDVVVPDKFSAIELRVDQPNQ